MNKEPFLTTLLAENVLKLEQKIAKQEATINKLAEEKEELAKKVATLEEKVKELSITLKIIDMPPIPRADHEIYGDIAAAPLAPGNQQKAAPGTAQKRNSPESDNSQPTPAKQAKMASEWSAGTREQRQQTADDLCTMSPSLFHLNQQPANQFQLLQAQQLAGINMFSPNFMGAGYLQAKYNEEQATGRLQEQQNQEESTSSPKNQEQRQQFFGGFPASFDPKISEQIQREMQISAAKQHAFLQARQQQHAQEIYWTHLQRQKDLLLQRQAEEYAQRQLLLQQLEALKQTQGHQNGQQTHNPELVRFAEKMKRAEERYEKFEQACNQAMAQELTGAERLAKIHRAYREIYHPSKASDDVRPILTSNEN